MRPIHQLVHARTRVEARYALMPLEGFPDSRLSSWPTAKVKVLASPRLGAEFAMYLIELPANEQGTFGAELETETFFYVIEGEGAFTDRGETTIQLRPGSFGLTPSYRSSQLKATTAMRLLILRKTYEHTPTHPKPTGVYGNESDVSKNIWADDKGALLQTLIPDDLKFDLAMNIFTFEPGHGLPIVETHVMEHGALILEGKGLYYLGGEWMEVEAGDFIYMAPFCPQSFYATGTKPAKYIYYKNVNREIPI